MLKIYKTYFGALDRDTRQFCIRATNNFPIISEARNAIRLRIQTLAQKSLNSSKLPDKSLGDVQTPLWWFVNAANDRAFLEVVNYFKALEFQDLIEDAVNEQLKGDQ